MKSCVTKRVEKLTAISGRPEYVHGDWNKIENKNA